jgi:hypothetical protein
MIVGVGELVSNWLHDEELDVVDDDEVPELKLLTPPVFDLANKKLRISPSTCHTSS